MWVSGAAAVYIYKQILAITSMGRETASTVGTRVAGSCCRHCDRQVMRATCAWRAGWARATIGARVAQGTTCEGRSRPFGSGEVWHRRRAGDGAGQRTSLEESEPPKCLGRHVCTGLRCLPPKHATRHPHTTYQNTNRRHATCDGGKGTGV